MKKSIQSIFLTLLSVVLLASCSKEEMPVPVDPVPVEPVLVNPDVTIEAVGQSGADAGEEGINLPQDSTLVLRAKIEKLTDCTVIWNVNGTPQASVENEFTFTATELGEYTVGLDVSSPAGGKAAAEIKIKVYENALVRITLDGEDPADDISIPYFSSPLSFASEITPDAQYTLSWMVNQQSVSSDAVYTFTPEEAGDYQIILNAKNQYGTVYKDTAYVNVWDFSNGTFVVNEGNMTTENGCISFISPNGEIIDSVYYQMNGTFIGNVVQDMWIANDKIYFVSQNGEIMGGDGSLVIADAKTLKKQASYPKNNFQNNGWPAHVAVVDQNVFIQGNSGITLFDEAAGTFTLIEGTSGAARNNMAVVGDKLFASAGNAMLVLQMQNGTPQVTRVTCSGRIGGIVKSHDNKIWLACGGSPSTISKVDPNNYTVLEKHDIPEVALGLSRRTSPTICAKGDTIYMKAEGDRATKIFQHIFSQGRTVQLIDMAVELENGKQGYNAINVHPVTGEVYINTLKGYGWDFLINNLTIWNFSGPTPVMKADYKNHTRFPAGVYFTENYL